MKKFILFVAVITCLSACKKQFDLLPKTEQSAEGSFDSYDGAFKGVSALYSKLGNSSDGLFGAERFMMPSDITQGTSDDMKKFTWSSTTPGIISLWRKYYAFIAQANIIIQSVTANKQNIDASFSSSAMEASDFKSGVTTVDSFSAANMLLAETRFLRAYAYFTLYRYYGGVPLITEPQGTQPAYVPRASREEIFTFLSDELNYAIAYCSSNATGIAYGRVTKGAAASLLAKVYVFHASYIRRAQMYGDQIAESKDGDMADLYAKANTLCDDIINGKYGTYKLVNFYPSIFTKSNQEIIFGAMAQEGVGTGNLIPFGFQGAFEHGAEGGATLTSVLPQLYDIPLWEYGDRFKTFYKTFGESDIFQTDISTSPKDSLVHLFTKLGKYTLTGDSTRRMWNAVKGWVTGPKNGGLPYGLWIFEPMAQTAGPEFYITPGKQNNYTDAENSVMGIALESFERTYWTTLTPKDRPIYTVNWHCLGKFRNPNPASLDPNFDANNAGINYPIIRLGEIYLLKAEAQLLSGNVPGAINTINIIRNRARYQSTIRDLTMSQGDAPNTYIANSVTPIPDNLDDKQALKELLYERLRELCGEDDCAWLDAARFPDVFSEDMDDISRYSDPLQGVFWFDDPNQGVYGFNSFNTSKVYRTLLPIPFSEFNFFPQMKQNPGY